MRSAIGSDHAIVINNGGNCVNDKDLEQSIERKKMSLILNTFHVMGVDVFGPTDSDFNFGYPYLGQLTKKYGLPFVISNLELNTAKQHQDYIVIEKGGKKFLIAGVLDSQKQNPGKGSITTIENPMHALKRIQNQVPHDVFIAMLHTDKTQASEWLKNSEGLDIDIAILDEFAVAYKAEKVKDTLLVYSNNRGRNLGYLDILFSQNSKAFTIGTPQDKNLWVDTVKEDEEIKKYLVDYLAWDLNHIYEKSKRKRQSSFYLGTPFCVRCHGDYVSAWEKTAHAKAWETLEKKGKAQDPECLRCHVTGFEQVQKMSQGKLKAYPPQLRNVQCEMCHGPAGDHIVAPEKKYGYRVDEYTCLKCHNTKMDPNFDYEVRKKNGIHKIIKGKK